MEKNEARWERSENRAEIEMRKVIDAEHEERKDQGIRGDG